MKQINDYTLQHLTALVMALLVVGLLCVPAVSAETIIDETMSEYENTGGTVSPFVVYNSYGTHDDVRIIRLTSIENHQNLPYIGVSRTYQTGDVFKADGEYKITYTLFGETHPATMYITNSRDVLGRITSSRILVFFDEWEIVTHIGAADIVLSEGMFTAKSGASVTDNDLVTLKAYDSYGLSFPYTITVASTKEWKNRLIVSKIHNSYEYELIRTLNSRSYASLINLSKGDDLVFTDYDTKDIYGLYPIDEIDKITISSRTKNYVYNLEDSAPESPESPVTNIYVRNAHTGALIAGTNLNVNLYETETWYNSTLEWGWDSIQLPAGNYEFYAEKSGFTQYAPGRLTVDGVGGNINLLLYPDVVAPPAGNLTLQFWVCDSDLNGIPYAELSVKGLVGEGASFDSGIIQTNNLGYATLTAPGNSTYTAYASKPGYTAGENEFGVTTASPVHITVMLMAGAVPTQTSVTPTITVTPTQTTPPIQEDNLIGLSVKGLAKGFGIDYDTALLMFGLMIIFGAGGMVMSSVKGGAMEFIAGSIVGTCVAFALGLIPIWIFIIIAVVFGAYVLRVFVQGSQ